MRIGIGTFPARLMENLTLPLSGKTKPKSGREKCNLYIQPKVKLLGAKVALRRYNYSLSDLVERLLEEECKMKRGLLPRLKE